MTKTPKGYDKIISVFFRKAYVGLKINLLHHIPPWSSG